MLASFFGTFANRLVNAETAIESYIENESILLLSIFAGSYVLGRGIAALASGKIFDAKPKKAKEIMFVSLVFMGLISLLYTVLDTPFYTILRLMPGVFAGLSWPIVQSMLLSISEDHEKSTNMSLYFISEGIGSIIAYAAAGFIKGFINILLANHTVHNYTFTHISIRNKTSRKETRETHEQKQSDQVSVFTIGILSVELGLMSALLSTDLIIGLLMSKRFTRVTLSFTLSATSTLGMAIGFPLSLVLARIGDVKGAKRIITVLSASLYYLLCFSSPLSY